MNLATYINNSVREHPDKIAIRYEEEVYTYSDYDDHANALASYLLQNGFSPNDILAVYMPNRPDYIISFYAAWKLGGICLPVNYRFRPNELAYVLENSGAKWVLLLDEDYERMKEFWDSVSDIKKIFVKSNLDTQVIELPENYTHRIYTEYKQTHLDMYPAKDSDDAILMYTSGTTGLPKGVRQTHRNNSSMVEMLIDAWGITSRDHTLCVSPMFHVSGLQTSSLITLFSGGTITILPKWSCENWIEMSIALKPTWSLIVSTMIIDLVNYAKKNAIDKSQFDSYRFCIFGGSSTPEIICDQFEELYDTHLYEVYGQTEMTGVSCTYHVGDKRVPGSMGKVMPQVLSMRVVSPEDGRDILPGEEAAGELLFSGDCVTPGYWKNEGLTKEKIKDGWLQTGDLARWDANGNIFYIDRLDDMIVTGGENVFPKEVENVLAEHPKVSEVAVIGTPHERLISQVTAFIVPLDLSLTEEEVDEFCKHHPGLAGYKRPRQIILVDELPKTGSQKIHKVTLREMYAKNNSV